MIPPGSPHATLRLQLHRGFPFDAVAERVPYFSRLGISHLYLSPILTARAGSNHGYDVVDLSAVNPELGGEPGLRALVARLREHGMGLIVDIVPNHMAVGGADNAAWLDVLEWGRSSRHAGSFDIDWDVPDPALRNRVLAPFLGEPYGEALAAGELRLHFDAGRGRFHVGYHGHRFPLAPESLGWLLGDGDDKPLGSYAARFRDAARVRRGSRGTQFSQTCQALAEDFAAGGAVADGVARVLQRFDASRGEDGRLALHHLLERQHYRLAWWRTAPDEINWRRFFDITDLAGIRVEEPAVFEWAHGTLFRLYAEGLVDGLRVDHVDGLADPRSYCRRLRQRLARLLRQRPEALRQPAYLVVEKILASGEPLPLDWQVDGTTGYSFMDEVGGLLHDPRGEPPLSALWAEIAGPHGEFGQQEREARRRIPQQLLASDFNACARALHAIARSEPAWRDWSLFAIRRVLAELLVHLPVYRTYADARGRSPDDAAIMAQTVAAARAGCRPAERPLLDLVDRWLGGEPPRRLPSTRARRARLRAIGRFQQLSSPVAAKAVEDTVFYRHGRLLSRNEVGASPARFAIEDSQFHAGCAYRASRFPRAMLATATHDHKRGEDVRARLAVLSEVPDAWREQVGRWMRQHEDLKVVVDGCRAPDPVDQYMLYQMLVGAWPLLLAPGDSEGVAAYVERIAAWQLKAVREAKRHSSWSEPNEAYERACRTFLDALFGRGGAPGFPGGLHALVESIAAAGASNGLAQTLIKLGSPGVSDFYQGCEFWDFSLVDPDNRRPVDYGARSDALAGTSEWAALLDQWRDGRIKQRLIQRMLAARAGDPALFTAGSYRPLQARGPLARHIFAFAREHAQAAVVVVATRFPAGLVDGAAPRVDPARWQGTCLQVPRSLQGRRWRGVLEGSLRFEPRGAAWPLDELLQGLTVGALASPAAGS